MIDKEEIEKAKQIARDYIKDTPIAPYDCLMNEERKSAIILMNYINSLEIKVKELGKGNHSLMQSRRKWKNRYYKEKKRINKIKNEIEADKMEQFDDYVIYLQEKYLDILKS